MVKMNDEFALNQAIELTKIALEQGLVYRGSDSEETAKEVVTFINTLFDGFTKENND
ncbi:MAG: hypothetical protein RR945_01990 [Erysipelotrichaceae bacterium]